MTLVDLSQVLPTMQAEYKNDDYSTNASMNSATVGNKDHLRPPVFVVAHEVDTDPILQLCHESN